MMSLEQQLNYINKNYKIIGSEQEFIVHPAALGLMQMSASALQASFSCTFRVENFRLILDKLILLDPLAKPGENEKLYEFKDCMIPYNGAILIGVNLVKEYHLKGNIPACFSFQNVIELVFEDGILTTTIDQNRAMSRVRKNLELGLRSLSKSRDIRCIKRFLNSSFVGDYNSLRLNYTRLKHLKEMEKAYPEPSYTLGVSTN